MESQSVKCPNCRLINPASAQRCDCGYDFCAGTLPENAKGKPADLTLAGLKFGLLLVLLLAGAQAHSLISEAGYVQGPIGAGLVLAVMLGIWSVIYKSKGGKQATQLMAVLFAIGAILGVAGYSLQQIFN